MATVHETAAALRVQGYDLDPDEISSALGRQPSAAHRRDDIIAQRSGHERRARMGMWSLTASNCTPGDLDAQITKLLDGLTSDLKIWSEISSHYKMDLFCGLFLENGNEGISISPATLRALGARGILLDLDIYSGSDESPLEPDD